MVASRTAFCWENRWISKKEFLPGQTHFVSPVSRPVVEQGTIISIEGDKIYLLSVTTNLLK